MNRLGCLSKMVCGCSLVVSVVVFILLPKILEKSPSVDLVTCSLRDIWFEMGIALPVPTLYALTFADHKTARILIFVIVVVSGISLEVLCDNGLFTGIYHLICLCLGVTLGGLFLFACLLPGFPLGC